MTDEKPTGDAGASISEQLESLLAAEDGEQPKQQEEAPAVEDRASDAPEEDEGPQYELPEVAKVLGLDESLLDVDEDGSLQIKTKIDGKEGTAKLQDLIRSYQTQGYIDQKARHVAEQERQVTERVSQYEQIAQSKFHELDALAQAAQQMVAADYASINWDQEFIDDPVGAPKKQYEFQKRMGQVQQYVQYLNAQKQQVGQAFQQHQQMELQKEAQRLMQMVPEWADSKVRETEGAEMRQWLQDKGVNPRTINALSDAGLVSVIREAFKGAKAAPVAAAVEKKVRSAPKLVRPGKGVDASDRKTEAVRGLEKQIRASGGKQGIAEYLIATGKV